MEQASNRLTRRLINGRLTPRSNGEILEAGIWALIAAVCCVVSFDSLVEYNVVPSSVYIHRLLTDERQRVLPLIWIHRDNEHYRPARLIWQPKDVKKSARLSGTLVLPSSCSPVIYRVNRSGVYADSAVQAGSIASRERLMTSRYVISRPSPTPVRRGRCSDVSPSQARLGVEDT